MRKLKRTMKLLKNTIWYNEKGFGLNEILGIAAGIIIAALVVIPGLRNFSQNIIETLVNWWSTIQSKIFLLN